MASFQKTLHLDVLSVKSIYARSQTNSNIPAFRVLTSDGVGGTMWMTLSSLKDGGAFHKIITSGATYTADSSGSVFSILDGPNAGLINDSTAPNTAYLYAKAFSKFDISGGNSIVAFNSQSNTINSNVSFVGTGGINIRADPQLNVIFFDGRELPFISTMPYSFSQVTVYSNVPPCTLIASTSQSAIIQANGPSSLLSFVGVDTIRIDTNYATNQIKFTVPNLTNADISTIKGTLSSIATTYVKKIELSTLSTSYGHIARYSELQVVASSLSTGLTTTINTLSTSIGNVGQYSRGISTVWYASQKNSYLVSLSANTALLSTSAVYNSDIANLYELIQTDYNVIKGSTFETPYFAASTLIDLVSSNYSPVVTPINSINSIGLTYYPSYPSLYNAFNRQTIGNPKQIPIYNTNIITTNNNPISTVSTADGTLFSDNYALNGSFTFYPEDDTRTFQVKYSGALYLTVFNQNYGIPIPEFPRLELFTTNSTIVNTIAGFTPITVQFTYLKRNVTDFISFSNMYDVLENTGSFQVARLYPAYGYNTLETQLYTTTIPAAFPIGFSTLSNLSGSPYLQLSSYTVVASTLYTIGCNLEFPISTSAGYTSIDFYETATANTATAYAQNLAVGMTADILSSFSASNSFGYINNSLIPNTPYILQLVYTRLNDNENLQISTLYQIFNTYKFTDVVFVSSLFKASTVSSYSGEFVYLNTNNLNVNSGSVSSLVVSSISSYQGAFSVLYASNAAINSGSVSSLVVSSISSYQGAFSVLYASNAAINSGSVSSLVVSSISSYQGAFSVLYASNAAINSGSVSSLVVSSISSYQGEFIHLYTSTGYAYVFTISSLFVSSINYGQPGGGGSGDTTSSTSTLITYINQVNSTINSDLSTFSTLTVFGGSTPSTLSTFVTYINQIASTINKDISTFSTLTVYGGSTPSTLSTFVTYINQIASTINKDISTFSTLTVFGGSTPSTLSSFVTYINQVTSTLNSELSTFSSITYVPELHFSSIRTSSITVSGLRQPFIQYGTISITSAGSYTITLPISYINTSYVVQVTFNGSTATNTAYVINTAVGNFTVTTSAVGVSLNWTTFGNIF